MAVRSQQNLSDSGSIKLVVIIPLYGNWDDTVDCVKMLAAQNGKHFHVYLADDGSPEPPPPEIHSYDFVTYFRRPHAGFAATCNAAAVRAADEGFTHLLLLNNDTSFCSDFTRTWIEKVICFPDAIMGPQIYYSDDPGKLWYSGGSKSILIPFFRYRKDYKKQTPVDILTGCVLLVPVKTWLALGGLDETYVTYYEDFDFVLKARDAGVMVYLLTESELRVWHKISRTSLMQGRWSREYRMLASRLLFIRKRYTGIEMIVCLAMAIPHVLVLGCFNLPELPRPAALLHAFRQGFQRIRPSTAHRATRKVF